MPTHQTPTVEVNKSMNKVKVGVIGIGTIGFAHAVCISENKIANMQLEAVCDIDFKRICEFKNYILTLRYIKTIVI